MFSALNLLSVSSLPTGNELMQKEAPTLPRIEIGGAAFDHLHTRRGRSLYRSDSTYLRIGTPAVVERERRNHERLFRLNFPVPFLLGEGDWNGWRYTLEESAGAETFGEMFARHLREGQEPQESPVSPLVWLVVRYAEAQLSAPVASGHTESPLAETWLTVPDALAALDLLPEFGERTRAALARIDDRLKVFPAVFSHGDFQPYNLCPRGVIDLEQVTPAHAGFDVVSWLLVSRLNPPGPPGHRLSPAAQQQYLAAVDNVFAARGLPPPSRYADEFLLCKLIAMAFSEHEDPELPRWARAACRDCLVQYLTHIQ